MIAPLRTRARNRALGFLNGRICDEAFRRLPAGRTPSFIVVTPHLIHLAPLAARNHPDRIQPVFIANGIGPADVEWLAALCPDVPLVPLRASFSGNAGSLIEHGVVIDYLARASRGDFCIQDADCFVTDPAFWDTVRLDPATDYAAGPFLRRGHDGGADFPETFLLCLNRDLLRAYRRTYGISAACTTRPPGRARRVLRAAGYADAQFLETLKDYYDTLQQYWVAARHHGYRYRLLGGEGDTVHHIGGTSYLHRSFDDLAHWDYWPLNVHYFHLRLLELPACARFRDRFARLVDYHGTAGALLAAFPAYAAGWRRRESDRILDLMGADALYSDPRA